MIVIPPLFLVVSVLVITQSEAQLDFVEDIPDAETTTTTVIPETVIKLIPPTTASLPPSSGTDPCLKDNHVVLKDETLRSFNQPIDEQNGPLCDNELAPGWYQFQSLAGTTIPTGCPALKHCGTKHPIWLRGEIPSINEGIVNSQGCIHIDNSCCGRSVPILLKNCSSFVVYFLQPTQSCDMAYCAGHMVPCPLGLESSTGFTPCQFMAQLVDVSISVSLNKANNIEIRCSAQIEQVKALETIAVEVDWLADANIVHQQKYLPVEDDYAILPRTAWNLGQTLQCRARVRHVSINTFTPQVISPEFFAGIQITSHSPLALLEGGDTVDLEFYSTLPVGCPGASCCINLKVDVLYPEHTFYCPTGEPLDRLGLTDCLWSICKNDWNITHKIPLHVKDDDLYNGNQQLAIQLQTFAPLHKDWADYKLPLQQVIVVGEDVKEKCVSDSYIHTFDGLTYAHQLEGTFMLFKNGFYEVHVTYKPCGFRRNCNCAVKVQAKHSTFLADYCSKGYLQVWSESNYGDESLQDIAIIQQNEGRTYKLVLPSGTTVIIGPYLSFINIHAFASDMGKTSGLCGSFDRDSSNDLTTSDGINACTYQAQAPCAPFSKRWRTTDVQIIPTTTSGDTASDVEAKGSENYCACRSRSSISFPSNHSHQFTEQELTNIIEVRSDDYDACDSSQCAFKNGIEMSEEYLKFTALEFFTTKETSYGKRAQLIPYEKVVTDTPQEGWTEIEAKRFCENYVANSEAAYLCAPVTYINVADRVQECAEEVTMTGNAAWAAVALNHLKYDCQTEVYRNLSLWELSSDGKISAPAKMLSVLCINNCSQNGVCRNGQCYCNKDFSGSDCSVNKFEAPKITGLTLNPCDVQESSCKYIAVSGPDFAEHPNLKCSIEIFVVKDRDHSTISQGTVHSVAEFLSFQIVICTLPDLPVHTVGKHFNKDSTRSLIKVGVCYGDKCSEPLDLWVIDSRCWNCTLTEPCTANLHGPCFYYNPYYTEPVTKDKEQSSPD